VRCRTHTRDSRIPESRPVKVRARSQPSLQKQVSFHYRQLCRPCLRLIPARSDVPRPACDVGYMGILTTRWHAPEHGRHGSFSWSAHTMLTSNIQAKPVSAGSDFLATDFVSSDAANLASHMSHCAGSHSPFFPFRAALQSAHSALTPRLVTVAAVATICLGLLAAA